MATIPTVTERRKAADVAEAEINAAFDAVLADLAADACPLVTGRTLDLVGMLRTNARAAEALKVAWRRNRVRFAILRAHPVTG